MVSTMIKDIFLFPLREIGDDRGAVLHMLRNDAPEFTQFGECYFSEVVPGAIKAWKRHSLQTQNIAVPLGRVRFVLYDNREGSETNGKLQVVELGRPDAYLRIRIPPGIWYGFTCISAEKALLVNCADIPHQPSESEMMPIDQSFIPYTWEAEN